MRTETRERFEIMDKIGLKAAVCRAIESGLKTAPDLAEFEAQSLAKLYCVERLDAIRLLQSTTFRSDLGLKLLRDEAETLELALNSAESDDFGLVGDYLYDRGRFLNEEDIDMHAGLALMHLARRLVVN